MKPAIPLHRWPEGKYREQNAASHSDVAAFAARQRKRLQEAQAKHPIASDVVRPIIKQKAKA